MGNPATLQPKPFTSEHQPARKGRPKGSPNRATVFKKLLTLKAEKVLLDATEAEKGLTLVEAAALGQLLSARKGNTNAWKEIQDSIHGKMADKSEVDIKAEVATKIIVQGVEGNNSPSSNNSGSE